jgi:acyl carrier protein
MANSIEIVDLISETMYLEFPDKESASKSSLQELGLDSLDSLEFLHLVQDKYDLNLKNDRYNNFLALTPEYISNLINQKLNAV